MGEDSLHPSPSLLREAFDSGLTRSPGWRRDQLRALDRFLRDREEELAAAVRADVGKTPEELFFTEIAFLRAEIRHAVRHLGRWMRPRRARVPLLYRPASASVTREPKGVVLIIGAWNYPLQLVLAPLVGALAAGNCVILKPSELAPHTSAALARGIGEYLDPRAIRVAEGGPTEVRRLLGERFDHVFFTGSRSAGREVMRLAAGHATPVTLELGGRCPCIVDSGEHLRTVARRIVWAKFLNAGQTCIAPDHVLVRRELEAGLASALRDALSEFYGPSSLESDACGAVRNAARRERLVERFPELAKEGAGERLAPMILEGAGPESVASGEEIFGPVLPLVAYDDPEEAIALVRSGGEPLAVYLFSPDRRVEELVRERTRSGGLCVNDLLFQAAVPSLPFGGVGRSGFGAYHGRAGFETFSVRRSLMKRPLRPDTRLRYPPYRGLKYRFLRWIALRFQ